MLKVKKVSKKFGAKTVLDDVSFELKSSTVVGLLGPNGAGKTTLMRIMVGFFDASEGEVVKTRSKLKIGYLPENNPLYGYFKVYEYLKFVARGKESPVGEIEEVAKVCGLMTVLDQKIETLSKGFRQRVGLAAALIGNPDLLILDEPTTGLDPNQIIEIRELIKKLAKKKTIILSTHILPEAKAVSDRILLINQGKIVLDDETKKIKNLEKKFVELTS